MSLVFGDSLRKSSQARTAAVPARRILIYAMNHAPEFVGVGRYTGEIADHLAASGANVTVITTPPHYPDWSVQPGYRNRYSATVENGVRVLRAPLFLRRPMKGVWRLIAPFSFAMSSAPLALWHILRHRPHTVLCIEPTLLAAPAAQLAAWLVGAKAALHVQDLEVDAAFAVGHLSGGWLKRLGLAFERLTVPRFDCVLTISSRMAERLAAKGVPPQRLCVVRNWVDLAAIYPLEGPSPYRTELGFAEDDFVVLYSGSIGAKQGLSVLMDAAERLSENKHIRFVIAGEGPAKAALQARHCHLPTVVFLPFQPQARLNAFLNMADLHVLPQEKDAADLVLPSKLGAMLASGKPLLVTAEPQTELAAFLGPAATLTPPGDADALAHTISRAAHGNLPDDAEARRDRARQLSRADGLAALSRLL